MENRVLIIDDVEDMCLAISDTLTKEKISTDYSLTPGEGLKKLYTEDYQVLLLDYQMPEMDGFEFIDKIRNNKIMEKIKIILITAYGDKHTGKEAINKGCYDFLAKPFNTQNLLFRINRALENIKPDNNIKGLLKEFKFGFENIIGNSDKMKKIYKIINQISDKNTTILIEGTTGTGKELIARAIHNHSKQKDNMFIPVNCGSLPETLLESELFGYEKNAFTGAKTIKYGIMETANNGTVFLDEINSASLNAQTKLLRFIETGEFLRVGGNKIIHSAARIITASNQNIEDLIKENEFREDLYHRLNIVKIVIPSLSERNEDIHLLINYFLNFYNNKFQKHVRIHKTAYSYLIKYHWPGNVRQLKNLIQSMVLLNEANIIKHEDLPETIKKKNILAFDNLSFKEIKNKVNSDFEIKLLSDLLKQTRGNVSKASKIIKLSRTNFIKKLKTYNIIPSEYK